MKQIETKIIEWFAARLADDDPIREQLRHAAISEREFTSGGGALLTLQFSEFRPAQSGAEQACIDGPEIRAPELASGASVTLHLVGGVANSLEIWSYAGDYPIDRHPIDFILAEPPKPNVIDLR